MMPEDQVKEIISMLSPESSEKQVDAVFLVKNFLEKSTGQLKKAHRRIEELEQLLQDARGNLHDIINERLKEQEKFRELEKEHVLVSNERDYLQEKLDEYQGPEDAKE